MRLEWVGQEPASGRDVFLVSVSNLEDLPSQLVLSCSRFVLLLAHDASTKPAKLETVLERLLDMGCVYLCTWGPGCEYTHDLMDETVLALELAGAPERTIMTTWHSTESLAEATEFALLCAHPDEGCTDGCKATVLAVVGNDGWLEQVRAAASEYVRFISEGG
jgi:hypothetical protein